jgi:hypothetical protein
MASESAHLLPSGAHVFGVERFLPPGSYKDEVERAMTTMTRCVLCGGENDDDIFLCRHHTVGDEDWASLNRLFCDLLHRGIVPPRPAGAEHEEPWVAMDVDVDSEAMAVV